MKVCFTKKKIKSPVEHNRCIVIRIKICEKFYFSTLYQHFVARYITTDQKNSECGNCLRSTELSFLQISKFRELCHAEEESYIYQLLIRYTNLRQYFFQNYICMFYIYRSEQSSNSAMVVFSSSFSRSFFS